jgi:tetratricopeptide (TPR) repeat protein
MKTLLISAVAVTSFACASAPQPIQQNSTAANPPSSNERPQNTIAHSTENQQLQQAPTGAKTKWTQSGEPIDTKEFDAAVKTAEKSGDKKSMSEAYYKRAVALTDARQYASALGDYRRALKNDPANTEAKEWIDKIIMIYGTMNKDYPKEGEEPPALPFTKEK